MPIDGCCNLAALPVDLTSIRSAGYVCKFDGKEKENISGIVCILE